MRTLFTATTVHIGPNDSGCGDRLVDALHAEFPAYYVSEWSVGDFVAAFWVEPINPVGDAPIPAHLNGWGHGPLVLKLVA